MAWLSILRWVVEINTWGFVVLFGLARVLKLVNWLPRSTEYIISHSVQLSWFFPWSKAVARLTPIMGKHYYIGFFVCICGLAAIVLLTLQKSSVDLDNTTALASNVWSWLLMAYIANSSWGDDRRRKDDDDNPDEPPDTGTGDSADRWIRSLTRWPELTNI